MKWANGRQNGNYQKLPLFVSDYLSIDVYLLKFPKGSTVKEHKDISPIYNFEHHRINIILKKPKQGGEVVVDGPVDYYFFKRIMYFRPDLFLHRMNTVTEGECLMLSIGWLK